MAAVTGLVERTIYLPVELTNNIDLMNSLVSEVTSLVYSDEFGVYWGFTSYYDLATHQQYTVVNWLMTPENDATYMTTIMPGMLTAAGVAGIQTYTNASTAGY